MYEGIGRMREFLKFTLNFMLLSVANIGFLKSYLPKRY